MLGPDHPSTLRVRSNLDHQLGPAGQVQEAVNHTRKLVSGCRTRSRLAAEASLALVLRDGAIALGGTAPTAVVADQLLAMVAAT